MQTIKKYANRKLYHINKKQYITLDGIADLIRGGEEVQIVDNETGEDITATILSQVALQSRGRSQPSLSPQLLTNLIQSSGDTLAGIGRSVWSALSGSQVVDDEIRRRIQRLREDRLIGAEEAARMQRLLLLHPTSNDHQSAQLGVPNQADVARLTAQVDALTTAVEQLLHEREQRSHE